MILEQIPENLRRAIFFARSEAVSDHAANIECIHLLLGLVRQTPGFAEKLGVSEERLREMHQPHVVGGTVDALPNPAAELPISTEAKIAVQLAFAAADQTGASEPGAEHLLCGLFLADAKLRAQLEANGLTQERLTGLLPDQQSAEARSNSTVRAELFEVPRPAPKPTSRVRCGIGYDLHRLHAGRKMMIGGIEVPFDKGPVGHSDGDVLTHAICDALLGAAALGDIGRHFPDTDPKWRGAASLSFLVHIRELLAAQKLQIVYIDAIVVAERPRLGPHFPNMRVVLAGSLGVTTDCINLKAKTNEGMDAVGRGEAIAAHAVATLQG